MPEETARRHRNRHRQSQEISTARSGQEAIFVPFSLSTRKLIDFITHSNRFRADISHTFFSVDVAAGIANWRLVFDLIISAFRRQSPMRLHQSHVERR